MKRKNILQTPFAPLLFFVIILCGSAFGMRGSKSKEEKVKQAMETAVKEVQEEKKAETKKEKKTSGEEKKAPTAAETAVEDGKNISESIEDTYAKQVIHDYCKRNVVTTDVTGMNRYSEENLYRQSFETLTGYMNLVRLSADHDTYASFIVATKMKEVTPVLIFPDMSYVVLSVNQEITCKIPKGRSTIVYVGKSLSGSIEVRLEENADIISTRM